MSDRIFLLLGGNKLNNGIMTKFQTLGYKVFVVDWNEHPQLVGDKHFQIDVKDSESIIDALKKDDCWDDVVFAYSSIDLAVPSVARINRAIGLKTISDEGLKYSSSKSMMTKRWNELGLLNRLSKHYNEFDVEILKLNSDVKLIIKPDNSASSRGITIVERNTEADEVRKAFEKAKEEASDGIVVVEEFVEGTEFTVEMIGDAHGNVSVYAVSKKTHTKNTVNNRIAVKLHYNAVDNALQKRIAEYGARCYRALHFSSSLGHLEVIVKNDGNISPVEIGARSSGYIASDLVDIASGSSFLEDLIRVQNGAEVSDGFHPQTEKSSMYFFYDFPGGFTVMNECNLLDFCDDSIRSRYYDRGNLTKGTTFALIDNDNARFGFEILEGPKTVMTGEYIEEKERMMLARMMGD